MSHGILLLLLALLQKENNDSSELAPFTKAKLETLQKLTSQPHISQPTTTQSTGRLAMQGHESVAFLVNKITNRPWILDSGASDHMKGDASIFSEYNMITGDHTVKIA